MQALRAGIKIEDVIDEIKDQRRNFVPDAIFKRNGKMNSQKGVHGDASVFLPNNGNPQDPKRQYRHQVILKESPFTQMIGTRCSVKQERQRGERKSRAAISAACRTANGGPETVRRIAREMIMSCICDFSEVQPKLLKLNSEQSPSPTVQWLLAGVRVVKAQILSPKKVDGGG